MAKLTQFKDYKRIQNLNLYDLLLYALKGLNLCNNWYAVVLAYCEMNSAAFSCVWFNVIVLLLQVKCKRQL